MNTNSAEESEKIWLTDVSQAIEQSKVSENQFLLFLLVKNGAAGKKLERQVLSKDIYKLCKRKPSATELDFPRGRRNLPLKQIELARKFNIKGYLLLY